MSDLTARDDEQQASPRVYVVVLNWNGASDTAQCVAALSRQSFPNAVFVVCDNDSGADDLTQTRFWLSRRTDELLEFHAGPTPDWRENTPPKAGQVVLLHTGSNLGFAGGVNVGLRYALAQGDLAYAWVLNNDTEVDASALTALVQRMELDPGIGICGSSLVYHGNRKQVQALGGASYQPWRGRSRALGAFSATRDIPRDPATVEAEMDYVVGASMLVSRRFLESVGLMDDGYFLYSEEHDWAQRGRAKGFKLAYAPASVVYHKHGATIGTNASGGSELSLYYLYRNKALFTAKHYPHLLPLVISSLAWDGLKFLLKGKPSKSLAIFKGLAAFLAGQTGPSYQQPNP